MYKNHARKLAGERVEYWYLKDAIQISDSLGESYKNRLSSALLSIEKHKEKEENWQKEVDMWAMLVESYKEEVDILNNEVHSIKKREFWIILAGAISLIGSVVVFN